MSRHLTSASLRTPTNDGEHILAGTEDHVSADFDSQQLYSFITRDNLELRAKICEFLKVGAPVHKPGRTWPQFVYTRNDVMS